MGAERGARNPSIVISSLQDGKTRGGRRAARLSEPIASTDEAKRIDIGEMLRRSRFTSVYKC